MKIGIHSSKNSFSDFWIEYCQKNNIDYKVVNAFDNDIIEQLKDCQVFMWHHHHGKVKDILTAKKILFALEHAGLTVFPNFNTGWHFDDKVAQKYLLEAINAPLIPSYVFYEEEKALLWAKSTSYPKVFKLKGGAGASNVKLIHDYSSAENIIKKSFHKGFPQFDKWNHLRETFLIKKLNFNLIIKAIYRLFVAPKINKVIGREKGYIYFQDFIPENLFDTRVVVIDGKFAIAEKRMVRKNDFRASGSGIFNYENIDLNIIRSSFEISQKLNVQSVAFDYVLDQNKKPLIVEICYGFGTQGINSAPGYWDENLNWYAEKICAEDLILKCILKNIE
ncbi:ATP-grasp domain-containing protein [Acinetobacter radioresistens]|uniref:ATP-grasp domain-containing protein n=1 Tax=Acinetobacter radioresistens TaxID=40216 RepID=UPI000C336E78|nr:hypothetical protein [Acinetobacter radioresistens]MCK4081107.1 hypothetical protein [Acinetobacter radioresistens]PKH31679.1 hypothetical protein BJF94_06240 [Acinetobacter radioresistens]